MPDFFWAKKIVKKNGHLFLIESIASVIKQNMILKPNFMKKSTKSLLLIREKIVKKKTGHLLFMGIYYFVWGILVYMYIPVYIYMMLGHKVVQLGGGKNGLFWK